MKLSRILMVLGIVATVGIFVFGTAVGLVYAKAGIDNTDAEGGATIVENKMSKGDVDLTAQGPDKGSPMHAERAIEAMSQFVGDIITNKALSSFRDYSARTIGYELQSLAAAGFLSKTDEAGNALPKGQYRILVIATPEQLDKINEQAKPIVDRRGVDGAALGIDSYRLDPSYLGKGDIAAGDAKLQQIRKIVSEVTGTAEITAETTGKDFVKEDIDAGIVPASAAINGDVLFVIDGLIKLSDKGVVAYEDVANNPIKQQALLAALVDTRMVSPEAKMIKEGVANFISATPIRTVMFKEELLDNPKEFNAEFNKLGQDETAVIIAINKNNGDIKTALEKAGLSGQWGNRIIVMGVNPISSAAVAFGKLFGDKNVIDLRDRGIDKILKDRDLVIGLSGAV